MKKMLMWMAVAAGACPVWAQTAGNGAVFPLPPGVQQVVSIDAQNSLLVASQNDAGDPATQINLIEIQHVYSGGIARLFGGTVLPAAMFLTPGFAGSNGATGATRGGYSPPSNQPNVTTAFNGNSGFTPSAGTAPASNGLLLSSLDRQPQQVQIGTR